MANNRGITLQENPGVYLSGDSSANDNAIVRFNGTSGNVIQNSNIIITDSGDLNIEENVNIGNDLIIDNDVSIGNSLYIGGALSISEVYSGMSWIRAQENIRLGTLLGTWFKYHNGNDCWSIGIYSSSSYRFYVEGNSYFLGNGSYTGTWVDVSDERLKKDIENIESTTDKLLKLRPIKYNWIDPSLGKLDNNEKYNGFLAQEVENIYPDLVITTYNDKEEIKDKKAVNIIGMVPLLIKGFQEQQSEIEDLKSEMKEMKQLLDKLLNEKCN